MNRLLSCAVPGVLALVLLGAPSARAESMAERCGEKQVALLPLEPLAISPPEAQAVEARVRAMLESLSGGCLQARAETVSELGLEPDALVPGCADPVCRASLAGRLKTRGVFSGVVRGLGGRPSVSLVLWDARGVLQAQVSLHLEGAEDGLDRMLSQMWRQVVPPTTAVATPASRLPQVLYTLAGSAAVTAIGFGFASGETARKLEGRTGCIGSDAAYAACFTRIHQEGRRQAMWANVFAGAGLVVAGGATLVFVLETP